MRGRLSTACTAFGTLKGSRRSRHHARSSAGSTGSRSTTKAVTASPHSGSGQPRDAGVGHRRMGQQRLLDLERRHVLAAADDQLLEPSLDVQPPLAVEPAEVARVEPAVGRHRVRRDHRPAHQDLALGRDRELHARQAAPPGCPPAICEQVSVIP